MAEFKELALSNLTGSFPDKEASTLAPNELSLLFNCRIKNNQVQPIEGHAQVLGSLSDAPYYLMSQIIGSSQLWYYPTVDSIFQTDGTTTVDVTRVSGGAYNTDDDFGWNGCALNSVLMLTNGIDPPQVKAPADNNFQDMPNFPATSSCKVIRSYQARAVAMNLVLGGDTYPASLLISDATDPGGYPPSWDSTDPTNLADRIDLAETAGEIRTGEILRDSFMVYKSDSVYKVTFIGGTELDRVELVFSDDGAISANAVQEFEGKHFVVGINDIYVHDGFQKTSIIAEKNKTYLFNLMAPNRHNSVIVTKDINNTEMIVSFSTNSDGPFCDAAWVWNWETGNSYYRTLPKIRAAYSGVVAFGTAPFWDTTPSISDDTWDTGPGIWDSNVFSDAKRVIIFVSQTDEAFYQMGLSPNFVDNIDLGYIYKAVGFGRERLRLDSDENDVFITDMIPRVINRSSDVDSPIYIQIGTCDSTDDPINWGETFAYTPSAHRHINIRATTKYISYKITSKIGVLWSLSGITFRLKAAGKRTP